MKTVSELINDEVRLYVGFCQAAALHDEKEAAYRAAAHVIFYHIQEMRTTGNTCFAVVPIPYE